MKQFLLCISFSLLSVGYGQQAEKLLKITYTKGSFLSPEGDFKVYLYADEHQSQFVFHQKKGLVAKDNYEMTLPFLKYINEYNFQTQQVTENRTLTDSTQLFSQWKNDLVWEITDEESEMAGYKVRKATATNTLEDYYGKVTAWFTTEVPLPLAPARYYGLPGLVVRLSYANEKEPFYILDKVEYIPKDKYSFASLEKENIVEKEDVVYYFHKNPKKVKEIQKAAKKKKK
ncbi:GLPGLI family protein [Capnocytophaga gingivalis]|uniref:GLPGLI family protein n=1 Tax=Capnocytophaga gingivalis TaxID=1017 RepID=UPI002889A5A9|nr:GLPGLI family protein [Capnocytophaga gingivalis]